MQEEQLIQLLRERDQLAFTQLIEEYKSMVEQIVFQHGIEPELISQVVQEIFLTMYRKIERLEEGTLSNWMYQVTLRYLKMYEKKTTSKHQDFTSVKTRYSYYIDNQRHVFIQYCLGNLDTKYKQPLILHYLHNKSYEEISLILRIGPDKALKRVKRGEVFLREHFEKMIRHELPQVSQEKEFSEQFKEMSSAYEFLPPFTDTPLIWMHLEKKKTSDKWKKNLPIVIGIFGLTLFTVFSIEYIKGENERQAFQEQQDALDQEKEQVEGIFNSEYGNEIPQEAIDYLEQAKVALANELGIESIEKFPLVQEIEMILSNGILFQDEVDAIYHYKEYVDMLLIPPSIAKEKLMIPDRRDEKLSVYLFTLYSYERAFQDYMDNLFTSLQITVEDYDTILSFQHDVAKYNGPDEIKKFMQILNHQGYYLTNHSAHDKLTVEIDFVQVKKEVNQAGYNRGYVKYLDIIEKYGYDFYLIAWENQDDILLELESLLLNYSDLYTESFREIIVSQIYSSLLNYIWGDEGQKPSKEEQQQEYHQFLENHQDSVYWNMVNSFVEEWEETNARNIIPPQFAYIKMLFDERFGDVKMENFHYVERWPIGINTLAIFKEYSESLNHNLLIEQSPLEIVSLYDYAFEKSDEVVHSLLAEGDHKEWNTGIGLKEMDIRMEYVLTEYYGEDHAIVHLTDLNLDVVISVDLIRQQNIWKIAGITKQTAR